MNISKQFMLICASMETMLSECQPKLLHMSLLKGSLLKFPYNLLSSCYIDCYFCFITNLGLFITNPAPTIR